MKKLFILFSIGLTHLFFGQEFVGQISVPGEDTAVYINSIFVTNLNTRKTVLANYNGEFRILAKENDVIRFTSIITDRKDVKVNREKLSSGLNYIQLSPAYYEIKEVIIGWKPSGNLRKDVLSLKNAEKKLQLAKIIGLPEPKKTDPDMFPPLASFGGGGLNFNIQSIYDMISGEAKKKKRLYEYEKMSKSVEILRQYFGDTYFTNQKIPKSLINNFIQFVYQSDNLSYLVQQKHFEETANYFEKYLPIYKKRLSDSGIQYLMNSTTIIH